MSALILWRVGMALTHVGLQQLVLPELLTAVVMDADVFTCSVVAADVALAVGVGGEGLAAAGCRAGEWFVTAVSQ